MPFGDDDDAERGLPRIPTPLTENWNKLPDKKPDPADAVKPKKKEPKWMSPTALLDALFAKWNIPVGISEADLKIFINFHNIPRNDGMFLLRMMRDRQIVDIYYELCKEWKEA